MQRVPTSLTGKSVTIAVGFLSVSTFGTPLACVLGINVDDSHAALLSFVLNETGQTVETPTVQSVVEVLGSLTRTSPASDALKVLEGDHGVACTGSELYDAFTRDVIHVASKPLLFTSKPFPRTSHGASGFLCLARLEAGSSLQVMRSALPDLTASDEQRSFVTGCFCGVAQSAIHARCKALAARLLFVVKATSDAKLHAIVNAPISSRAVPSGISSFSLIVRVTFTSPSLPHTWANFQTCGI